MQEKANGTEPWGKFSSGPGKVYVGSFYLILNIEK